MFAAICKHQDQVCPSFLTQESTELSDVLELCAMLITCVNGMKSQ